MRQRMDDFSGQRLLRDMLRFRTRSAVGLRLDFGLRWWSFERLAAEARRFACLLRDCGIGPGERIVLWGANSPEWVACLVGAMLRRVIVVPLDEHSNPDFVLRICQQCSPCMVVHDGEIDASFLPVAARRFGDLAACDASNIEADDAAVAPGSLEDTALIIYTSGTTAEARGVVLTYGNLRAQIEPFLSWGLPLRFFPVRMVVVAPLSHVQGLILGAMLPLSLGLSVIYVRSVHPTDLLRMIRDNRIVVLSTVPRVLQVMTGALQRRPYGRRGKTVGGLLANETRGWMRRHILFQALNRAVGLRFWVVLTGGAALARYDEQFWRDTGRFVIQGYGLTETTAILSVNGPFNRRQGSLGRPLKHLDVKISDAGEVLVKGASVTPGYFGAPVNGAGHEDANNGYFHTGDLVRRDKSGRLYFVGRKKDVIVTSEGFNVYPAEVEFALCRRDEVLDSVVVGRISGGCEEVHAVLLLAPDADAVGAVAAANRELVEHQRIRSWTVWPESDLPRSPLMKVRREAVTAFLGRESAAVVTTGHATTRPLAEIAQVSDRRKRLDLLADYFCHAPAEPSLEESASLRTQLGLSSLDIVQLLTVIERRQCQLLEPGTIPADPTVAQLRAATAAGRVSPSPAQRLPVRQPKWAGTRLAGGMRRLTRRAVVGYWSRFCHRCSAAWQMPTESLRAPVVFAAAPHMHWLDAFAVCAGMPARFANRLLIVTNRDFSEYFDPAPDIPWRERAVVGAGYYAGLPLTFPFTIVPHFGSTREGLLETARQIDRGYSPLVFPKGIHWGPVDAERHDRGMAVLARECGIPIVPVWISGNVDLGWRASWRPRALKVTFGRPVEAGPRRELDEIVQELEGSWSSLATGREA